MNLKEAKQYLIDVGYWGYVPTFTDEQIIQFAEKLKKDIKSSKNK
jgi:hypothetical protein